MNTPLGLLSALCARAADHANLEEGMPLELQDTQSIPFRGRELQSVARYERLGDLDRFVFEPRLEVGLLPNTQVALAGPLNVGEGVENGPGNARIDALYNPNAEGVILPALAIGAEIAVPTAPDAERVAATALVALSKTLPRTLQKHTLHANVAWTFQPVRPLDELPNAWRFALGYSGRMYNDLMFVTAAVIEQDLDPSDVFSASLGLGGRYQLAQRAVLSAGADYRSGFGQSPAAFRPTLAIQIAI